jgi:hypothetical protein
MMEKKTGALPRVAFGDVSDSYADFAIVRETLTDGEIKEITPPDFAAWAIVESNEDVRAYRRVTGEYRQSMDHSLPMINVSSFGLQRTASGEQTVTITYYLFAG